MNIQVGDISIGYDERGSGIPLLLIHGYPLNRKLWEPQLSSLSDIARVLTPDLRGHGDSEPGPVTSQFHQAFSMEMMADDCANFLSALGVSRPAVIGGLSMGGYIALAFARKYPQRLAGLILAATRAGADSAEGKANRDKAVALARESGPVAIAEAMLPKMMSPKTYQSNPELVAVVFDMMKTTSVSGIVGDLLGMKVRPDSTAFLPEIRKPTLLLYGADDQIIPQAEMESMATAIPDAQLIVIPDSGHLLNMEQPDDFNQSIYTFMTQFM